MTILLTVFNLSSHPALMVFIGLALTLHLWRLWRFTARVYFRPDDPKELPYWIPCMSCLLQILVASIGFKLS